MGRLGGLCLTTLVLSVSLCASAEAAPKAKRPAASSARARKGQALYQSGQYDAALVELQAAYSSGPDFELLFDIAQCERALNKVEAAARDFQAYLETGGDKVSPEKRSIVANELALIQEVTAMVTLVVPGEPAEVTVDAEVLGQSPFKQPVYVSPGDRLFSAFRQGQPPATKQVELVARQRITVKLDPAAGPGKVTFKIESTPPGARITVDGKPVPGMTPLSVDVAAGKHAVSAERDGYALWQQEVFADKSAESKTVVITFEAVHEEAVAAHPKKTPVAGLLITGAGVLALGGSIALSIVAGVASREVGDLSAKSGRWDAYYDARQASGERAETWSVLAGVGGGLLIATGLIVTLASLPPGEPKTETDVQPEQDQQQQPETTREHAPIDGTHVFLTPLKEGGVYGGLSFRF
jgi:hypothetical protein